MALVFPVLLVASGLVFSVTAEAESQVRARTNARQLATYPAGRDRLPANYEGVGSRKFLGAFKKSVASLKKRKTESDEQFKVRAADADGALRPISTKATYAFRVPGLVAQYSARRQAYVFEGASAYACPASSYLEGYVTCGIGDFPVASAAVSGAGRAKDASGTRSEAFGLAVRIDSGIIKKGFTLDRNKFYFNQELPVSAEKAQTLKDYQVSVLFVGNVVAERLVGDGGKIALPIAKDWQGSTTLEYDMPFKVSKVVYYVYETGEILKETGF